MAIASMTLLVACAGSARIVPNGSVKPQRATLPDRQADTVIDDLAISDAQQQVQGGRRRAMKLSMNVARATNCKRWLPIARAAGQRFGVDPWMLLAIAWVESGFSNQAVSSVGARGPMQLMPKTSVAFGCAHPQRPHCAFPAAAALYRRLLKRFGAREVYALCAYNAGGGRIASAWRGRRLPFNLWYAERVQAARARLKRTGCVPGA